MKLKELAVLLFGFLLLNSSCTKTEIDNHAEYVKYLADKDNGLVLEKSISGIKYKVKYLPAEYQAYNTMEGGKNASEQQKDSVVNAYSNSLTFLLNIGPDDEKGEDITKLGIANYEEFAERVEKMAFEAGEQINLIAGKEEIKPGIVRLENLNAMEKSRNFVVVFAVPENNTRQMKEHDWNFVYRDELFNTGTVKFLFKQNDIKNVPTFKF